VPDYSIAEAREQATKAARYFERVLDEHGQDFIVVRSNDTLLVVASKDAREKLQTFITDGGIGKVTAGVEDVNATGSNDKLSEGDPVEVRPSDSRAESQAALNGPGGSPTSPSEPVLLIARYHEPQDRGTGNVHLHALKDMKLGRRERKLGECLCSKKHGSKEIDPEGKTKMCEECVKVAAQNDLAWTLA
jgi:hypothetical protein